MVRVGCKAYKDTPATMLGLSALGTIRREKLILQGTSDGGARSGARQRSRASILAGVSLTRSSSLAEHMHGGFM